MNDRLHPLLLLLTMLDLGFVHATGAVDAVLLLPMWLFALLSPRLRRLQRFPFYRHAWNAGVLVVFSLLVHHATTTGLLHMLEDGLVLAVLCQVHLLNNIGEKQRPDLTFFNSFLIAFVTSFFAPDFWWSMLFVGHTLVFVPALQVYVLTSRGRDLTADVLRSLVRDSVPRTLIISAATVLVFVMWPRDFERPGWLKDHLAIGQQLQVGLAERIDLDRESKPYLSDKIALRIEMLEGNLSAVPSHWRANVFSEFDGRTWFPQDVSHLGSRFASDTPWSQASGTWRRPTRGEPHTRMLVQLMNGRSERLATTLAAVRLTMRNLEGRMLSAKSYAGFAIIPTADAPPNSLKYTIELAQPQPTSNISTSSRCPNAACRRWPTTLANNCAARCRQPPTASHSRPRQAIGYRATAATNYLATLVSPAMSASSCSARQLATANTLRLPWRCYCAPKVCHAASSVATSCTNAPKTSRRSSPANAMPMRGSKCSARTARGTRLMRPQRPMCAAPVVTVAASGKTPAVGCNRCGMR